MQSKNTTINFSANSNENFFVGGWVRMVVSVYSDKPYRMKVISCDNNTLTLRGPRWYEKIWFEIKDAYEFLWYKKEKI